jgi:hypothetical protein
MEVNMRSYRKQLVSFGLLVAASGCATTDLSELRGYRYYRAPIDTYPVVVTRVDERDYLTGPVLVAAGPRTVTVQAPPGGAKHIGDQQTITLDVKPCTLYYLVAVKTSPLAQNFAIKVDHEEPRAGCRSS